MRTAIATAFYVVSALSSVLAGQEFVTWEEAKRQGTDFQLRGKYLEAEIAFRKALRVAEHNGPNDPRVFATYNNLASVYQDLGRYSEAEHLYRKTITWMERTHGPDSAEVLVPYINLLSLYAESGHCGPPAKVARRIASVRDPNISKVETVIRLNAAAAALVTCKQYAEAEPLYTQALSISESDPSTSHLTRNVVLQNLGALHVLDGKPAAAVDNLLRAGQIA